MIIEHYNPLTRATTGNFLFCKADNGLYRITLDNKIVELSQEQLDSLNVKLAQWATFPMCSSCNQEYTP